MGVNFDYRAINYRDQREFDYFFATAFDRYDRNRDGVIDYREFQPMINDMCALITQKYGYGPTVDKIRAAWLALDLNKNGYITRNEFSYRARAELERILTQPNYTPMGYTPMGYTPGAYPPNYVYPAFGPYPPIPVVPIPAVVPVPPVVPLAYPPPPVIPVPVAPYPPPIIYPPIAPRIVSIDPFDDPFW